MGMYEGYLKKFQRTYEDLRSFKMVQEGSRRLNKVNQNGSKMIKKLPEGSKGSRGIERLHKF